MKPLGLVLVIRAIGQVLTSRSWMPVGWFRGQKWFFPVYKCFTWFRACTRTSHFSWTANPGWNYLHSLTKVAWKFTWRFGQLRFLVLASSSIRYSITLFCIWAIVSRSLEFCSLFHRFFILLSRYDTIIVHFFEYCRIQISSYDVLEKLKITPFSLFVLLSLAGLQYQMRGYCRKSSDWNSTLTINRHQ